MLSINRLPHNAITAETRLAPLSRDCCASMPETPSISATFPGKCYESTHTGPICDTIPGMRRHSTADRVWSCRCRTAASAAAKSPRNPATVRRTQPYDSSRTPRRTRRSGRICPPRPAPIQYFNLRLTKRPLRGASLPQPENHQTSTTYFTYPQKAATAGGATVTACPGALYKRRRRRG